MESTLVGSARMRLIEIAEMIEGFENIGVEAPTSVSGCAMAAVEFASRILRQNGKSRDFTLEEAVTFLHARGLVQNKNKFERRSLERLDVALEENKKRAEDLVTGKAQMTDAELSAYARDAGVQKMLDWVEEQEERGITWHVRGTQRLAWAKDAWKFREMCEASGNDWAAVLLDEAATARREADAAKAASGIAGAFLPTAGGIVQQVQHDEHRVRVSDVRQLYVYKKRRFKVPYGALIDWADEQSKVERLEGEPIAAFHTRRDQVVMKRAKDVFVERIVEDEQAFNLYEVQDDE